MRELDYGLAQAYMDGGIYNQALDILERLYETWPMEHRFGFRLAGCYQSLGRTADLRRTAPRSLEPVASPHICAT